MRSKFTIAAALVAALILVGCANKFRFTQSAVVPGAYGDVKVKKDKNENYIITVDVTNLADSRQLDPPKDTYVVWMETAEGNVRNIGQIKSTSSLLSKARKATMRAASTVKPRRVFITAEESGTVSYPGREILTTRTIDT
jgi:uncharacterized lipoprotein NlpE involved in copper resistance